MTPQHRTHPTAPHAARSGAPQPNAHGACRQPGVAWPAWALCWALSTAAALPVVALASTPVEKVVCTGVPTTAWMGEAKARALFRASEYALVKFKVSRGNCYEFYAIDHQNAVVEAYMHPVTGELVRQTRIPAPPVVTKPPATGGQP